MSASQRCSPGTPRPLSPALLAPEAQPCLSELGSSPGQGKAGDRAGHDPRVTRESPPPAHSGRRWPASGGAGLPIAEHSKGTPRPPDRAWTSLQPSRPGPRVQAPLAGTWSLRTGSPAAGPELTQSCTRPEHPELARSVVPELCALPSRLGLLRGAHADVLAHTPLLGSEFLSSAWFSTPLKAVNKVKCSLFSS